MSDHVRQGALVRVYCLLCGQGQHATDDVKLRVAQFLTHAPPRQMPPAGRVELGRDRKGVVAAIRGSAMPFLSLEPVATVLLHTGQSIVLYHLIILGLPLEASHRTKKPVTQRSVVRCLYSEITPRSGQRSTGTLAEKGGVGVECLNESRAIAGSRLSEVTEPHQNLCPQPQQPDMLWREGQPVVAHSQRLNVRTSCCKCGGATLSERRRSLARGSSHPVCHPS